MNQSMSEIKYALLYGLTESEKGEIIDYLESKPKLSEAEIYKRLEMIEGVLSNINDTLQSLIDMMDIPKNGKETDK